LPHDWLFEVESIIIRLVPAYTLEAIDECDVHRLLPYYIWDYRKALRARKKLEDDFVIKDGKKFKRVAADEAEWLDKIF